MSNNAVEHQPAMAPLPPRVLLCITEAEREAFFPRDAFASLAALAGDVVVAEPGAVRERDDLGAVDVAIVAWGFPRLDADLLARLPRLQLVANAASSVRALVSDAFWNSGIPITQAGAAMAQAVAEMSLSMTLALLRRLHRMDHALRTGANWADARRIDRAREISGARIGVVGASRTGREYIRLCQALGADVRVYDPYLSQADPLSLRRLALEELLATSDVVALHAPATAETAGMIGSDQLATMRPGAALVNTARSSLVDMDALYEAVAAQRIDAALDVFDDEPLPVDDRWRALPNALLSGHVSGATRESRERAGRIVVGELSRFLEGEPLQHRVTRDALERMG